ncbi:MAG: ATP-binding protein [Halopseudomonas aestusnigri]
MKLGLRNKILLFTTTLVVSIALSLFSITYYYDQVSTKETSHTRLENLLRRTMLSVENSIFMLDLRELRTVVSDNLQHGSVDIILVLDEKGRVLTDGSRENKLRNKVPVDIPVIEPLLTKKENIKLEGSDYFWIAGPILLPNKENLGFLVFGVDINKFNSVLDNSLRNQLFVLIPALILSVFVAFIFSSRLTRPLKELASVAEEIGDGDFTKRSSHSSKDEIGELSKSINMMADNLSRITVSRDELRVVAERESMLKAQAETANLAKSNFLATMSHEIRTPLNGVLGMAQLLKGSQLDKDQQNKINTILSSGESLLDIINNVLDMSKIESGNFELEVTTFDLPEMVSSLVAPFEVMAIEKGLTIKVQMEMGEVALLKGDKTRLHQVLLNLISNAFKFTDKGDVILTVSHLDPQSSDAFENAACSVQIIVEDTGKGITADRLATIFDPFVQEDTSITRKFGGSGLGLAIVKKIIELMAGSISVTSQEGVGTQFKVLVPFDYPSKDEAKAGRIKNKSILVVHDDNLQILLAEDNQVNAVIAKAFLNKFGHEVEHVVNGSLAVDAVSMRKFDLVLMDVHMPEMDGIEATRNIRKLYSLEDLPIIGLTAEAFTDRHLEFKKSGMNDVLTKPFTEQQLASVLKEYGQTSQNSDLEGVGLSFGENPSQEAAEAEVISGKDKEEGDISPISLYPIGDQSQLDRLSNQLDTSLVHGLLSEAPESILALQIQLHKALKSGDSGEIFAAAHSIRGISSSMFATRLAIEAQVIESKANDLMAVRSLILGFDQTIGQTINWWEEKVAS